MKQFNKNKSIRKINIKQNKDTYIKKLSISLVCLILLCVIILFTFAKFETSSEEYTLINGLFRNNACNHKVGQIWTFDYTGDVQEFDVPCDGKYRLETWGAQGGQSYNNQESKTLDGGKGGYSKGDITLTKSDLLYIVVGGKGLNYNSSGNQIPIDGGYNGGGQGINGSDNSYYGMAGSGGGATDIRVNNNSLYARVIVAGGGGAASPYYTINYDRNYGAGGGTAGIKCMGSAVNNSRYDGGTQTVGGTACLWTSSWQKSENGSFGKGGNGITTRYSSTAYTSSNAGGGGGWYGGGSGQLTGGSGGSGWIYTAASYNNWLSSTEGMSGNWLLSDDYYLENASTINGNTSFVSPTGEEETGHSGTGYAKITYLGNKTTTIYSAASDSIYYYNDDNQKNIIGTTDNTGKLENANVFDGIKLYSSVAKDPNNLSNPYSKSFDVIDDNTYLMPNNSIYWYGYNNGIVITNSTNGWSIAAGSMSFVTPTFNNNSISATLTSSNYTSLASSTKKSGTSIHTIIDMNNYISGNSPTMIGTFLTKNKTYNTGAGTGYHDFNMYTTKGLLYRTNSPATFDEDFIVIYYSRTSFTTYALWYE